MAGPTGGRRDAPMVISLKTLLEYALDVESGEKRVSGNVRSFETLFEAGTIVHLDRQHSGVYSLLLFHPTADSPISEYLSTGALGSDSGPRILTLFTVATEARVPLAIPSSAASDWPQLDRASHPAYTILRTLFEPKPPPALPGIIFMGGLDIHEECVYASLAGIRDSVDARTRIAHLLALADRAIGHKVRRERFANDFAVLLRREGAPYSRSGRTSVREFLISAFRMVSKHKGDIVTGLKLGVGKL